MYPRCLKSSLCSTYQARLKLNILIIGTIFERFCLKMEVASHSALGVFFMILFGFDMKNIFQHKPSARTTCGRTKTSVIRKIPWEGLFIIIVAVISFLRNGFSFAKWTMFREDGELVHMRQWQHCTIFAFFIVYGIAHIIIQKCTPTAIGYLQIFRILTFGVMGFLFYFHTHPKGDQELTDLAHGLYIAVTFSYVVIGLIEMMRPDVQQIRLLRVGLTLLTGTWLVQVGYFTNSDVWNQEYQENLIFVSVAFTWHVLIDTLITFGICSAGYFILSRGAAKRNTATLVPNYSDCSDEENPVIKHDQLIKT